MGKAIGFVVVFVFCMVLVLGANYDYIYNPYTARQDRSLSLNQTGFNITADNFFGIVNKSTFADNATYADILDTGTIYIDSDIDDNHIEGDLNTYVDIAGDTMVGNLTLGANSYIVGNASYLTDLCFSNGTKCTTPYTTSMQSLVMGLSFNNASLSNTLVYDSSGNRNDGTTNNGVVHRADGYNNGGAFKFDGIDDYISVPDSNSFTNFNITVVMWVKPDATGQVRYMMTKGGDPGNWEYSIRGNGEGVGDRPEFNIWGNVGACDEFTATSSKNFTIGSWNHAAFVYSYNTSASVYLNGELVGSDTTKSNTCNFVTGSSVLNIGRRNAATYFNGSLDDIMIFNRVLSAEEIKNLYLNKFELDESRVTYDYIASNNDTMTNYVNSKSAASFFAWVSTSQDSAASADPIKIGTGVSEVNYSNSFVWNGTDFMVNSTGIYEIDLYAYVSTTIATDFLISILADSQAKRSATGSALATSRLSYSLSYVGCINSGQNVTATIDSNTANSIVWDNASSMAIDKKSSTC